MKSSLLSISAPSISLNTEIVDCEAREDWLRAFEKGGRGIYLSNIEKYMVLNVLSYETLKMTHELTTLEGF